MIKINTIRETYKAFNSNTKLIIRATIITTLTLIFLSIFSYNSNQYELLKICDDLLEAAKSIMIIGFGGALFFEYISKLKKD